MNSPSARPAGALRTACTYVEMDGQHSGFLRLRVKINRDVADRLEAHCRRQGWHTMVFYRDTIDDALEDLLADLTGGTDQHPDEI